MTFEMSLPAAQVLLANKLKMEKLTKLNKAKEESKIIMNSSLKDIKGIGEKTIELLIQNGITTTDDLRATPWDTITNIVKNPISRQQVSTFLNTQNYAESNGGSPQERGEEEGS